MDIILYDSCRWSLPVVSLNSKNFDVPVRRDVLSTSWTKTFSLQHLVQMNEKPNLTALQWTETRGNRLRAKLNSGNSCMPAIMKNDLCEGWCELSDKIILLYLLRDQFGFLSLAALSVEIVSVFSLHCRLHLQGEAEEPNYRSRNGIKIGRFMFGVTLCNCQ
jgi:hypothetical protein